MKLQMMCLIIILLAIGVTAQPYTKGSTPTINARCIGDTQLCSNLNSNCSITIQYPNSSIFIADAPLTYSGDNIYYQVSSPMNTLGEYPYSLCCSTTIGTNCTTASINIVDDNFNYGGKDIIDYKFYILLTVIWLVLLILFAWNKSLVIGVATGAIGILISIFLWFWGINISTDMVGLYQQLNPTVSRAVGITLATLSTWLVYVAFVYRPQTKGSEEVEFAGEDE